MKACWASGATKTRRTSKMFAALQQKTKAATVQRALLALIFAMGLLGLLTEPAHALPLYQNPGGYPAMWPDQLATQAYTRRGGSQNDITGNPDPSRSASISGNQDFSSGGRSGAGEGTEP